MSTRFPELDTLNLVIALPSYNGSALNRVELMYAFRQLPYAVPIATQASLLACCFNITLSGARKWRDHGRRLSDGTLMKDAGGAVWKPTHFLMMHDDICPTGESWFEHLWAAYKESKAQMICTVSPIKDHRGLTSVAVEVEEISSRESEARELVAELVSESDPEYGAHGSDILKMQARIVSAMVGASFAPKLSRPRRLTLTEISRLATTFSMPGLLLNTGMLLFDIREPWVDKVWFHIDDSIEMVDEKQPDGSVIQIPVPRAASEDWNFTRDARKHGCERIFATTAVQIDHVGQARFPNYNVYGIEHDDGM